MKILKLLLFSGFLFSFSLPTNAKLRKTDEASAIARSFLHNSSGYVYKAPLSASALQTVQPFEIEMQTEKLSSDNFFHIFNIGTESGFVIVSSDDRAKSILGYSDTGSFDPENIPVNLKSWLSIYSSEIKSLNSLPENPTPATNVIQNTENKFATSISPLLKNIKWNQGAPYNNLCPIIDSTNNSRAATGCGATAMAQIMKYYNWPVSGTSSNSYTTMTLKIPLSVNFATTQYDWTNMTDNYNTSSTDIQKTAIAILMYHCGVAANMDYNSTSNSYTTDVAKAFINYFGYDQNLQVYIRDYYAKAEWDNYLKTELNAARPVLYNGQASYGGHLFVCDGYDSNGLYHFNWGWGGVSDGYFELSALNPNDLGIGGGNAGGYNGNQYMIKGIQKPSTTSTPSFLIYTNLPLASYKSQVYRTDTFSVTTYKTFNYGINSISGQIGVGLFNGNTLIQVLGSSSISKEGLSGWNWYKFYVKIPTSVSNGNYKIFFIYRSGTVTDWQIVRGKVGTSNYLDVNVATNYIYLSIPTDALPKLTLNSFSKTGNLYQHKTGRFTANISNTGNEYNSKIAIYLQSVDNSGINQFVCTDPENIAAGETEEMIFSGLVSLAPGQYDLTFMYDAANNPANTITWSQLGNKLRVEVFAEPTGTPSLSLISSISFPDPEKVYKSKATLNATITNTGGYFENKLNAFIFPKAGGTSLHYIGRQTGIIDQNETKTFSFSGGINLDPNDYLIGVYYFDNISNKWIRLNPTGNSSITFNLKDDLTAYDITNFEEGVLYPNPAIDVIHLKLDKKVTRIKIIDVYGKEKRNISPEKSGLITINISDLPKGTYIISSQSDGDNKINKFIKK